MTPFVFESLRFIFYCDWMLRSKSFESACVTIAAYRRRDALGCSGRSVATVAQLCRGMDFACALYFKRVHCLQRSAATTMLLRTYGYSARMVIGAQIMPFKSHAWVEVDGTVVNDKPYMHDIYSVLKEC